MRLAVFSTKWRKRFFGGLRLEEAIPEVSGRLGLKPDGWEDDHCGRTPYHT